MLSKLTIKNFQSIESVDLLLGPVTVLTGPSSSGKSALLRALIASIENPRGSTSVRSGAKASSVVVTDSSGEYSSRVTYQKSSKGSAAYALKSIDPPGPIETFTAIGSSVPEEISQFFELLPASIGRQFDPPFLLTETPAKAAAHFSALSAARVLLDAVAKLNAWQREENSQARTYRSLAESSEDRAARAAPFLEELDLVLPTVEEAHSRHALEAGKAEVLSRLVSDLRRLVPALQQARQAVSTLAASSEALRSSEAAADEALSRLSLLHAAADSFNGLDAQLAAAHTDLSSLEAGLQDVTEEFVDVCADLAEMTPPPTSCPVCDSALDSPDKVKRVEDFITNPRPVLEGVHSHG